MVRQVSRSSLLITAILLLNLAAAASNMLQVERTVHPPNLEVLSKGLLGNTGAVSDFRQRDPKDGSPASLQTTAYVSYDQANLYVVFVCKDRPADIRAHLGKRDLLDGDDYVSVYLDTFQDRQRAYVFSVNALGIQRDGTITEGQKDADYSFDTVWTSEGRLTEDGYRVRMAIPFRSLRFPDSKVQRWGIALGRYIARKHEDSYWPYITKRLDGFVQQMGVLSGVEQVSSSRSLQFIPYALVGHSSFLDDKAPGAPQFRSQNDIHYGLDSKVVLRNSFTVDFALNPDFSQVESDEPQVLVNQRFEVFFPEKRPFFIENAGFFQTPVPLFFSRRIADPQFGIRLTGKVGRWAIGALSMDDRAPGRRLEADDPRSTDRADIRVLRVQREFGTQSNIGMLFTSRQFASSYNRVLATDLRLKLNPNWVFTGQLMHSENRDLKGKSTSGPGYFAELAHSGRHLDDATRYSEFSPEFHGNELGFVKRVGFRQVEQQGKYRWHPKHSLVRKFGPSWDALLNWDPKGQLQDALIEPGFKVEFGRHTELEIERTEAMERFQGINFRRHSTELNFETALLNWLSANAGYSWGTNVNFKPASGLAPFLAEAKEVEAGFTLRPTAKVRFDQSYIFSRLGVRADMRGVQPGSIFNDHVLRSKLNYQFSRALSLRGIVDYESVLPNPKLVRLEHEKRLTADILATYMVNPGTAIYVGYTNRFENLEIGPTSALQRIASPVATGRQFYVKVSYLFRY